MQNVNSRPFVFGKASLRKLATYAISLLNRHPQLKTLVRSLLRAMPGAKAIAARLRRSLPSDAEIGPATAGVPAFQPAIVQADGVVTVEGLYHLSRSL